MNQTGPGAGPRKGAAPGSIGLVLAGALIGFYILLPLDRGFPTVPFFGRPVSAAIVATLGIFIALALQSRGRLLSYLREPYCVIQTAYFCILVASGLRSDSPPSALHWSLLYYCTFVLNYVMFRFVTRRYGARWLSVFVVAIGVAAAAIGIVQALTGTRLPLYDAWFADYFGAPAEDYANATARAAGTMNNPILYSMAMVLVIPYALDLPQKSLRFLALAAILLAAGLSGSRTALLILPIFMVGAVIVYQWRTLWAVPAVCLGLVMLVQSLGGLAQAAVDPRVSYLLERVGLIKETEQALAADRSITYRQEALAEGFREMSQDWTGLTWIAGRGYNTSQDVGERVYAGYNTVDNVFLGVIYEQGVFALVLFISAFAGFLIRTRRVSTTTLHWYVPLAMAMAGVSFSWNAYSTFNILAAGSMAIAMWHAEQGERSRFASRSRPRHVNARSQLEPT